MTSEKLHRSRSSLFEADQVYISSDCLVRQMIIHYGCIPLEGSGSGFMIQDHSDHGVPKEQDFGLYDQLP